MTDLSLILPVLNEEKFIEKVVLETLAVMDASEIDYEILLAENGSTDNSLAIMRRIEGTHPRVRVCIAPHRGWGIAILTGYSAARGEYFCHMPSDGQVDAATVPVLFGQRAKNKIVKICRVTRENAMRYWNSKAYNMIGNLMFRLNLRDINGCPKLYHRTCVQETHPMSKDSFIDLEFQTKAKRRGYRIVEIPTAGLERIGGKSNTSLRTVMEFVRNMLRFFIGGK